jgi:tetratricopeptide (TPR) repeat protein
MNSVNRVFLIVALGLAMCLGPGCSKEAKAAKYLKRADAYFAAKEYSKADIEYQNVLRLDGKHAHAYARLASVYLAQGRTALAFQLLPSAVELNPNDTDLRVKLASIYAAAGKIKEAQKQATVVLEKSPRDAEAPLILVGTAVNEKETAEVRRALDQLKAKIGNTAPLELAYGTLSLRSGDLKAAEAAFLRAKELDPKNPAVYTSLGVVSLAKKDIPGAEQAFKTAAELSPPDSQRRIKYAEFKAQIGDVALAKDYLDAVTKEAPDYVPGWLARAELALQQKDYETCTKLLGQTLARDRMSFEAQMLQGRLFLETRQVTNAITQFQKVLDLSKNQYGPAALLLAKAHLQNGDVNKAIPELTKALTADPNLLEASVILAGLNLQKGNIDPAITSLRKVVEQQPRIFEAQALLAQAYLAKRDPAQALEVYQRMASLFPQDVRVPMAVGSLFFQQKKLPEARRAFSKAREMAPNEIQIVEQLINVELADTKLPAAMELAKAEQAKSPTNALPHLLIAKVHLAQAANEISQQVGKLAPANRTNINLATFPSAQAPLQQAEAELLKAIELNPDLPTSYLLLAQLYVEYNKHQEALERLNALVEKGHNPTALMQIGLIHEKLKDYPAAAKAYQKILEKSPDATLALNNLAYVYSERLNKMDEAYKLAERASRLQPGSPYMADTLGWILYRKGEYSRALALLSESAKLLGSVGEVQYHLGMAHYMLGEEELARLALERAVAAPDDYSGKDEARARLSFLTSDLSGPGSDLSGLEKRFQEQPTDPILASRLATIYDRQGDAQKAVELYQKLLKQNPRNAQVMGRLAELYATRLKDPKKALELAKEARNLDPDDGHIATTLGRLALETRDYQWALSLLQDAARRLPGQPDVYYDLARTLFAVGQVAEAEETMRSVVQAGASFPKLDDAKRFLVLAAAAKGPAQAAAAQAQAEQTLKAQPDHLPAQFVLALAQEHSGKLDAAKQAYLNILGGYPLFQPATRNLAVLSVQMPEVDPKAFDWATKARQTYPQDPQVARTLGILSYKRGDASRAAALLKESAACGKADAQLLFYLGMSQSRLKQSAEAKKSLQDALAANLDPKLDPKLAEEARKTLTALEANAKTPPR